MLGHRQGREEMGGAPLDEETLLSICVVTHPELVKVRQSAPVHASTTTGAQLDDEVGMCLSNTFKGTAKSQMVIHQEVALLVGCQITAAEVVHRHVAVPFYIM